MEFNPSEAMLLLFATIGPLRATIVCATLAGDASPAFLKQLAGRAVRIATSVCLVFAVLGELILLVFRVSLPAFQIAGGIIVMLFSIEMVMGGRASSDSGAGDGVATSNAPSLELAAYPIAVPLLASVSGLIAIVSLVAQAGDDLWALLYLLGAILAIMAVNYLCLRACQAIARMLGPVALSVVGKVMGVILVALAVELVLMGLVGLGVMTPIR
ncbi:MarC family protein [Methylotetracoccus oryzae]|uniref:MarC family protein n=1 Tax=Methylotetracoccus oryzae TaxID=1919059 RepID=UPI0013A5B102|nr:MarC family protein [Methylotetracoccus oryzae]